MAVEELGELVEASEGIEPGTPGSSTSLPTSDAALARVVESLKVTTEKINVPDGAYGGTEPPYFWKVMQPFKWVALVGDRRGLPRDGHAPGARHPVRPGHRRRQRQEQRHRPGRPARVRGVPRRHRGRRRGVPVPDPRQQVHPEPRRLPPAARVLPAGLDGCRLLRPRAPRPGGRPVRLRPRPRAPVPPADRLPAAELGVDLRGRHARDRRHRAGRVPADRSARPARRDHRVGPAPDRQPGVELGPPRARHGDRQVRRGLRRPPRDPQPRRRRHPDQEVRRRVLATAPGQVVRARRSRRSAPSC